MEDGLYYDESGELDIINLKEFEADGGLKGHKRVKHFKDGRHPEVTIIK
jgi:hypothetical protein